MAVNGAFAVNKGRITMTSKTKELNKNKSSGITRRQFFKISATGAVIAGTGTLMFPRYGAAKPKTLKILQWVHFVPGYDKWFNETYPRNGERKTTPKSSWTTSASPG
jgi:hypothetical protein